MNDKECYPKAYSLGVEDGYNKALEDMDREINYTGKFIPIKAVKEVLEELKKKGAKEEYCCGKKFISDGVEYYCTGDAGFTCKECLKKKGEKEE